MAYAITCMDLRIYYAKWNKPDIKGKKNIPLTLKIWKDQIHRNRNQNDSYQSCREGEMDNGGGYNTIVNVFGVPELCLCKWLK